LGGDSELQKRDEFFGLKSGEEAALGRFVAAS
jgi:hypothetical protein